MAIFQHSCEGPDGTEVTTTNAPEGSENWAEIDIKGYGRIEYDETFAATGSSSIRFFIPREGGPTTAAWVAPANNAFVRFGMYVLINEYPRGDYKPLGNFMERPILASGHTLVEVDIETSGRLSVHRFGPNSGVYLASSPLTLGQPFRLDVTLDYSKEIFTASVIRNGILVPEQSVTLTNRFPRVRFEAVAFGKHYMTSGDFYDFEFWLDDISAEFVPVAVVPVEPQVGINIHDGAQFVPGQASTWNGSRFVSAAGVHTWDGQRWVPEPPVSGWEFDGADWQVWRGHVPAGGMPVPTLAEQPRRGPVVQITYGAVLLADGSVLPLDSRLGSAPAGSAVRISGPMLMWLASDLTISLLAEDGSVSYLTQASGVVPATGVAVPGPYVGLGRSRVDAAGAVGKPPVLNSQGKTAAESATWPGTPAMSITPPYHMYEDGALSESLLANGTTVHGETDVLRIFSGFHQTTYVHGDGALTHHAGNFTGADSATGMPETGDGIVSGSAVAAWYGYGATLYVRDNGTTGLFGSPAKTALAQLPAGEGWVAVSSGYVDGEMSACWLRDDGHIAVTGSYGSPVTMHAVQAAHVTAGGVVTFDEVMGTTDALLPWEVVWDDRVVPVPVGTASGTQLPAGSGSPALRPPLRLLPATGATAGEPGGFTPEGCSVPPDFAALAGIVASPASAWTAGQHVVLGDGSQAHWDGDSWEDGAVPRPPAETAVAGIPGHYLPTGSEVPADLAALAGVAASPADPWTVGQFVATADHQPAHWDGTAWQAGAVPLPPGMEVWGFDRGDWQGWIGGPPPGGLLLVPTLADRGEPVGDVLQISGHYALLADGSVVHDAAEVLPAGSAVAISHRGDYVNSDLMVLDPAGAIHQYSSAGGDPLRSWTDRVYVALSGERGATYSVALAADGYIYHLDSGAKREGAYPAVPADQRYVSTSSVAEGRNIALTDDGRPVVIGNGGPWNSSGLDQGFPDSGGGYTRVWTGYQGGVLEAGDGTLHPFGGYRNAPTDPSTCFDRLPAGPVRSLAYQATWVVGEGYGAYVDTYGGSGVFGSPDSGPSPGGEFVAVTGRMYKNDRLFRFLRVDGAIVDSNGTVVRGPA